MATCRRLLSFSHLAIDVERSGRDSVFVLPVSADVRGAVVQLWTAAREPSPARSAMGQFLPRTRDSAVLLLVQPCDDGLHMYAEFCPTMDLR